MNESERIHQEDDVDGSAFAHHHTLGSGANQAAPGKHFHDERYLRLSDTQMGMVQITGDGVGTSATAAITFDPPFLSGAEPLVFVSNNRSDFTSAANAVSESGFTAVVRQVDSATFTDTVDVRWVAFVG